MILERSFACEEELAEIEKLATEQVEESVSRAQSEKSPSPVTDDWKALASDSLAEG
jgi:TPP-dependent pyruvate/acetoin dehydrogenase alpha subunit